MQLEFTHKAEDVLLFSKQIKKTKIQKWRLAIIFMVCLAFITLINGAKEYWNYFGQYQHVVQIGLLFLGLFVLLYIARRRAKSIFKKDFETTKLAKRITISFDKAGITSAQIHHKTIWRWAAFHKYSVENNNIFLWYEKNQALMLPSRVIESDEERAKLMQKIEANISNSTADESTK
ncbi:MAG: hypothetical protein AB8B49_00445 [Nitratireductor sp.]